MDADDVQILGSRQIDGRPGENLSGHLRIGPPAGRRDGPAADDPVGQRAARRGIIVVRSEHRIHVGPAARVRHQEFLDGHDVRLERLENPLRGGDVAHLVVGRAIRQVGRHHLDEFAHVAAQDRLAAGSDSRQIGGPHRDDVRADAQVHLRNDPVGAGFDGPAIAGQGIGPDQLAHGVGVAPAREALRPGRIAHGEIAQHGVGDRHRGIVAAARRGRHRQVVDADLGAAARGAADAVVGIEAQPGGGAVVETRRQGDAGQGPAGRHVVLEIQDLRGRQLRERHAIRASVHPQRALAVAGRVVDRGPVVAQGSGVHPGEIHEEIDGQRRAVVGGPVG